MIKNIDFSKQLL